MQVKKDNYGKEFHITSDEDGFVKVSIKDGYVEGDVLKLDLNNINSTWNNENKELLIPTSIDNKDIYNILDHVLLATANNNNQQIGRFIEVEYISNTGESISLDEYVLNTNSAYENYLETNISIQENEPLTNAPLLEKTEEVINEIPLNFDYEETIGADFLESSVEENLLYEVNLKENGDIYKILKDSFTNMDILEIHGYDISQDKVSLEDFTKEFGDSFNYSVHQNNEDLNVNINVENHKYNVVLKDVLPDTDTKLEDIIQHLIINSGEHKV